jgi:small conductance mechanosensitive channel
MEDFWRKVGDSALAYAPNVLGAVFILLVGWAAVHYLVEPLRRLLARSRVEPTAASFVASSARSVLVIAIFLAVLQQLGLPTASLLTLVGAAGLAVALSLQNSLANFASGLIVLSFRIVRVGDTIEVGDLRGEVREMLPFHVVLVTEDNQRITLPNTKLTSEAVRNHSYLQSRRGVWSVPLRADDDVGAIKEELARRLRADPRVLPDPPPELYVREWGDDRRTLTAAAWTATADYRAVQQGLLEALGQGVEAVRRRAKGGG